MHRRTDKLYPQPRGRPRKDCQWDRHNGRWIPIKPQLYTAHHQDAREQEPQRQRTVSDHVLPAAS